MTPPPHEPTRRERLRPAEYVVGAAIAAVFTGIIVFFGVRDLAVASIWAGAVFIIVLVVLALLMMTVKPGAAESAELDAGRNPRDDDSAPRSRH